jgi:hypothetical protein
MGTSAAGGPAGEFHSAGEVRAPINGFLRGRCAAVVWWDFQRHGSSVRSGWIATLVQLVADEISRQANTNQIYLALLSDA